MSQNYCQACEDDMENQQAHFGGCIPDPYFYEDDIFNSEVQAANTLLAIKNEKCVHESFEKALGGTFDAQIHFSYYSSDWHYPNYVAKNERLLKNRDDWGVHVNGGDWVFNPIPFDIGKQALNFFGIIYTRFLKNIPTKENWKRYLDFKQEFIKPIKRHYGHPNV